MSCGSQIPIAVCDTVVATGATVAAGASGYLTHSSSAGISSSAAGIPLTLIGIQPSCLTVNLVVDATATAAASGSATVQLFRYADDVEVATPLQEQTIQFNVTAANVHVPVTTAFTVDVGVGKYSVVAVVANTGSTTSLTINARANILAVLSS